MTRCVALVVLAAVALVGASNRRPRARAPQRAPRSGVRATAGTGRASLGGIAAGALAFGCAAVAFVRRRRGRSGTRPH